MKHLLSVPIAALGLLALDPNLSQGRMVSLSFEPGQKQNNDYVLKAPYYTLENDAFQKLWDAAKSVNPTRVIREIASKKTFSFVHGDRTYIFLQSPSPGYDFEGLCYRYTAYDREGHQVGKPISMQVVGVREWIKNRGRPPGNMDLPVAWYGYDPKSVYLKMEFVQDGRAFVKERITP